MRSQLLFLIGTIHWFGITLIHPILVDGAIVSIAPHARRTAAPSTPDITVARDDTAEEHPGRYDGDKVIKVAILMTDGEYNTVGGSRSYVNASRSTYYARDTCQPMKDDSLIIYTVGFKLDDATAITTLRQCASSGDKLYTADDGNALRLAFRNIAQDLARLRLAK